MDLAELLETVRRVEVRTNRLVNDTMVGAYLSQFRGRGMDFEELREYMPGDDVRDIDWNVTNRMGRPFVKRFREERELAMVLAIDISASSTFGSGDRTKREFATEVATTIAMSAARSSDKVALLLFTDQVELFVPPRKGRRHILRLLREMLFFKPKHRGTDIPAALTFLNHVLHRRSLVFLLTDFLHSLDLEKERRALTPALSHRMEEGETDVAPLGFGGVDSHDAARLRQLRSADSRSPSPIRWERAGVRVPVRDVIQETGLTSVRHDLVCVHLHDPLESAIPAAGLITFEDAETGELLEVDSSRARLREQFARTNADRLAALDSALLHSGVDTLRLNTGEPFAQNLQRFFELRRGRRRG